MELSILQHPKDNNPRTVSIGEVADLIREGRWPSGYPPILLVQEVFEGGTKQSDIVRMSGLAVTCFPAPDASHLPKLREAARDDPHTLLMFGSSDNGLTVIYAYELDKSYDVESQRKFYQKVLVYGNDYYEAQLESPPLRKGRDVGRRSTLCHDPDAYFNPNADWFFAMEILEATRPHSGKLKSTDGLRERKASYQERMMTVEEIEDWLSQHIELHRNVITGRQEYRWLTDNAVTGTGHWLNYDDHTLNTLYRMMKRVKDVKRDEIDWVVCSDYARDYNPFRDYFDHLPPWDGDDYILALAAGVTVAGGFEAWKDFQECLRKWLVGLVAAWLNDDVVNQMVLVFIGRQGIYKTTWMNHLLPPCLQDYYTTQQGVGRNDKDAELALSQYGLICCEELDKMRDEAMNAMKRAITLNYTNVRGAYQRHAERRPHIASFCGTGNNEKFLNDPTGTRRWLVFKVESLVSPLCLPFEYEGIYAQAYYLYRQGYKYWFDDSEATNQRNSRFLVANLEQQLVQRYFRKPVDSEPCEFVDVATALQQFPVNVSSKVRKDAVDQAFIDQDFQAVTLDGIPGYYAIIRKPDEIRTLGLQMAYTARGIKPEEKS
jgi:hypothetical protein